jgi:hypothetical protein
VVADVVQDLVAMVAAAKNQENFIKKGVSLIDETPFFCSCSLHHLFLQSIFFENDIKTKIQWQVIPLAEYLN